MLTIEPPPGLAHPPRGGLAHVEGAAEVHREHVVPLLRRQRVDVADLADACAVHDDVDATEPVDGLADRALDVGRNANVAVLSVEARNARALALEQLGDLLADPAG
jgi:hypothetical protein